MVEIMNAIICECNKVIENLKRIIEILEESKRETE
jgi:hypothetical protein